MKEVLQSYGINEPMKLEKIGNGLIHSTWKVKTPRATYILQQVNDKVFKDPALIAGNIRQIAEYLGKNYPEYVFVTPIPSCEGSDLVYRQGIGLFRLFPFVAGSRAIDVVETPAQAREAAIQFGRFTRLLSQFDVTNLNITLPHFHDLSLRYSQFLSSVEKGNQQRVAESKGIIGKLTSYSTITDQYQSIISNPEFRLRVTHHDTKISNVLFDKQGRGICVIDMDTVMPGYFISDLGDMMRTYLSPVSEEEKNYNKIMVREEFYRAIIEGYYSEMKNELTQTEKNYFLYAGQFMIFMQAIRFLTDYLNDDAYYGSRYPGQNLVRAGNQLTLLERLTEKADLLNAVSSIPESLA